ncbi:hypothetical protein GH733_008828 [Mirounga leonina]|nr:hypothetical protein GH733_008828 [Mirounga leonina]
MDILSALVTRLQDRFKAQIGTDPPLSPTQPSGPAASLTPHRTRPSALVLPPSQPAFSLSLLGLHHCSSYPPGYVWDRMLGGFKHKNFRTREGTCLCLVATLNASGAHTLTLSKIVPHICNLLGDPNSQVRDAAINSLVEIYRHVGERVRADLSKKGLPQSRSGRNKLWGSCLHMPVAFEAGPKRQKLLLKFGLDKNFDDEDSVDGNRPSSASSTSSKAPPSSRRNVGMGTTRRLGSSTLGSKSSAAKEGAGAVDEEDFIKAFDDVPVVQLKKIRSLLLAGAAEYDNFFQHLRLLDGAFKLSAKDLRSQVVREACITLGCYWGFHSHFSREAEHLYHTLESSYQKALQSHLKNSDSIVSLPQSDRSSSSSQESLKWVLLLAGRSLPKEVLLEAPPLEVRPTAMVKAPSGRPLFPVLLPGAVPPPEASHLLSGAPRVCRACCSRCSGYAQQSSTAPAAKGVSTKSVSTTGSLQRSRSDIDVNAAASAKSKVSSASGATPFSSAAALPPGSYASLAQPAPMPPPLLPELAFSPSGHRELGQDRTGGRHAPLQVARQRRLFVVCVVFLSRIRTRRQSSGSATNVATTPDSRGRSRAKVVSQSQPGSRSSSPGKLLGSGYGGLAGGSSRGPPVTPSSEKRSKIPRSQGCSRETSPNRIGLARSSRIPRPSMSQGCSRNTSCESSRDTSPARGFPPLDRFGLGQAGRIPGSVNAMRVLSTSTDLEAAVADALKKPVRRRYEPYGMYSDDDANSDASSVCSERSYGSRNGGIPHYLRQTEDVAEVLNHCASSNWSERKEGLLGLQNLLKSQRTLSRVELKRLCEIFTRMFADPHSKVFSMFLETLVDFIIIHKDDLQDWLFVLLTQLLKKMGADLLGSVQAKFNILMRFIVDQTQTPNLKVKVAILKYIESLARQMDPTDFVNSSETRLAVSRIITWTTEPKSSDVRKAAQIVLISLFELNTPEFTMLLGALPKTFQDGATKLLHNHLKNASNTSVGSPSNTIGRTPSRHTSSRTSPLTSPTNCSHGGLSPSRLWGWSADGLSKHPPPFSQPNSIPTAPSHKTLRRSYSPSMLEYDTENLNSEEIYSSLRGVTEAIEKFSFRSQEDLNEPIKRDGKKDCDIVSRDGGVALPATEGRGGSDVVEGGRTALDNKTSLLNTQPPRAFPGPRVRDYNPYPYSDTINTYDKTALKEAVFDDDMEQLRDVPIDHSDLVADLLKELSNHNERVEERKGALLELLKITREDSLGVWEEHFKTILLLLLETLGDKDHSIRALALRVLREILRNQPARFKNYAELTIMKTLEAHKDSHKEVSQASGLGVLSRRVWGALRMWEERRSVDHCMAQDRESLPLS